MKKIFIFAVIILLVLAGCSNPFFPGKVNNGTNNNDTGNETSRETEKGKDPVIINIGDDDGLNDIDEIIKAIQDALEAGEDVVIKGTFETDEPIVLDIPPGSKVTWEADITGNIDDGPLVIIEGEGDIVITGKITNEGDGPALQIDGGSVTVEDGAVIENTGGGPAIVVNNDADLTVNGGDITAEDNNAIILNDDSTATINGGTIENDSLNKDTIEVNDNAQLEDNRGKKTDKPVICLVCGQLVCDTDPETIAAWNMSVDDVSGYSSINATTGTGKLQFIKDNIAQAMTFSSSGAGATMVGLNGFANNAWWLFQLSTNEYKNINVKFNITSSNAGPKDFKIQYKNSEEGTWHDSIDPSIEILTIGNIYTTFLKYFPIGADNKNNLFIRIIMVSEATVNGSVMNSSGRNSINNITISGAPISCK